MKRFLIKYLWIGLLLISTSVYASLEPSECAVLRSRPHGMFSIFQDVMALVQNYEKGIFKSIKVDFANEGQYYEPFIGPNWWEYYFEPINNQNSEKITQFYYLECWKIQFCNTRIYNNYLIEKYIKIRPYVHAKVNSFVDNHFKGADFVIGIHYRGTDKVILGSDAPRVPYPSVAETLREQIGLLPNKNYLIFAASDEVEFIHFLNKQFPGKVCANMEAHATNNNYERGLHALIDCLLLSKTNLIMRTDSNLSLVASFFNYQVPVIALSKGFWKPPEDWKCD